MPSGEDLKNAIKVKGLTVEKAAKLLDMTRANLYLYINKASLDDSFVKFVNTKLDINLIGEEDYRGKYIALLEKNLKDKEENISSLRSDLMELKKGIENLQSVKKMADDNRLNLIECLENQKALYATLDIVQEQTLNYFAEKKPENEREDYLHEMRREKLSRYLRSLKEGIRIDIGS